MNTINEYSQCHKIFQRFFHEKSTIFYTNLILNKKNFVSKWWPKIVFFQLLKSFCIVIFNFFPSYQIISNSLGTQGKTKDIGIFSFIYIISILCVINMKVCIFCLKKSNIYIDYSKNIKEEKKNFKLDFLNFNLRNNNFVLL